MIPTVEEIVEGVAERNALVLVSPGEEISELERVNRYLSSIPELRTTSEQAGKQWPLIKLVLATNRFTRWAFSVSTQVEATRRVTRRRAFLAIMGHLVSQTTMAPSDKAEISRIFAREGIPIPDGAELFREGIS